MYYLFYLDKHLSWFESLEWEKNLSLNDIIDIILIKLQI